jgi:hypothetical protein
LALSSEFGRRLWFSGVRAPGVFIEKDFMSRALLFWVLMILWLVIGLWFDYTPLQPYPFKRGLSTVLVFILLAIIGWQIFGTPVR